MKIGIRTVLVPAAAVVAAAAATTTLAGIGIAAYLLRPKKPKARKVVLITGGSRGLGLALAERFGRSGARLVLTARNGNELERAREILLERGAVATEADVYLIAADLTVEAEATAVVRATVTRFGQLDVLINNAGVIEVGPVEDQHLDAYRRAMDTNFFAALHMIQAAMPVMLANFKGDGERAAIVNISSIGGKFAMPHLLPYVASKFALTGLSEGLHAELRSKGIRVTTVCPGLMRTGSHVQAEFSGDRAKEYRWFAMAATTPGIAASTTYAANRIFDAVKAGRAEITITPQAWLAARLVGVAPCTTQFMASLVNRFLLPEAAGSQVQIPGGSLPQPWLPFFEENSKELRAEHNQG